MMRQADALVAFEEAARLNPGEVRLRLSIGHLHKTLGHRRECEQAYKACLELDPSFGEAYWSLADLKNYVFSDTEIAAMQALLKGDGGDDDGPGAAALRARARARAQDRLRDGLRPLRDRQQAAPQDRPVRHRGIREQDAARPRVLRRRIFRRSAPTPGYAGSLTDLRRRTAALRLDADRADSRQSFERRRHLRAAECADHRPRVRSREPASTMPTRRACAPSRRSNSRCSAAATSTRRPRSAADGPHFIDKMPNNFSHVGLIHAMLPNAIVDRRAPPPDGLLLQHLQAVLRGRPVLQLRPRGSGPLLPLLPEPHGPLGHGAARQGVASALRSSWCAIRRRTSAAC